MGYDSLTSELIIDNGSDTVNNQHTELPIQTANTSNSQAKIFIIGDSTVHNTDEGEMGWGSSLNQYLLNPENIFNQARSGASSKSFKVEQSWTDHDWSNTKDLITRTDTSNGAYLFIQFGHNDEIEEDEEGYVALTTSPGRGNSFYTHLTTYIDEARSMGVTPVLITPVEGMLKNTGEQTAQFHGEYAQTIRDLAEDKNVLLLDLQQKSWNEFNNYNDTEELRAVFGHDDVVHFSPNGAASVARWIKELICEHSDSILCTQFE
jgi:pectinesterase